MNTLDTVKRAAPPAVFPGEPTSLGAAGAVPVGLSPVFAHQGGWDEILLVVAPLAVIGGLLWLANRRVTAQLEDELRAKGATEVTDADLDRGSRPAGDDGQD